MLTRFLYLCPTLSKQEGHELLHLHTNQVIMRHKVTPVPVTPSIISQVHALAHLDGRPPSLKISSHTNQILFHSAWTAGVDYDEEEFQDEDYEMESEDEEYEVANEEEEYDEMDKNELAEIMGEPLPLNVPNENNRNHHVNNNLQHDNDDPEESEETGSEDENENNNKASEEEEKVIGDDTSPTLHHVKMRMKRKNMMKWMRMSLLKLWVSHTHILFQNENNRNHNVNNNLQHDNDYQEDSKQGEDTKPNVSLPDNQQCEYQRSVHRRNRCTNSIDYVPFHQ